MRLIIDLQACQSENKNRGIGRYTLSLVEYIIKKNYNHEILLVLNGSLSDSIEELKFRFSDLLPRENIRVFSSLSGVNYKDIGNSKNRKEAEILREFFILNLKPDFLLIPSLFEGILCDAVCTVSKYYYIPTVVLLHDLIPLIHANVYLADEKTRSWYLDKLDNLKRADLIVTNSQSTANEAVNYLDFPASQVFNISSAASSFFRPITSNKNNIDHLLKVYGINRKIIMYGGGIDPRKNIEKLIEAFSKLSPTIREIYQLVIVCSASSHDVDRLTRLSKEYGLRPVDVILTGYVSEEDLLLFYNCCELFVFPSWHEGFGLPVLEAMQCGSAVIASNLSSLPEVVGRNDALFDPFDVDAIALKIQSVLDDKTYRSELMVHGLQQSKNFSWESTAKKFWSAMGSYASSNHLSDHTAMQKDWSGRKRMAYISPLSPDKSGIADYSQELLEELTRLYDITIVQKEFKSVPNEYTALNCKFISIDDFRKISDTYERVLFHFGNSEYHEYMFDLLEEVPGVVVLHDFYLSGIQAWSEKKGWRPYPWTKSLLLSHGYSAVKSMYDAGGSSDLVYQYPSNLDVLQNSIGLIVHSNYNVSLNDLWYGKQDNNKWNVLPHLRKRPLLVDKKTARDKLEISDNTFLVCAFGVMGETKLNHRLFNAWCSSALAERKQTMLVFVGIAEDSYSRRVIEKIESSNLSHRVHVTGWVDSENFKQWLQSCDLAVQLREKSRGETSGTILDCLNYGVPVIANKNGSASELDAECIYLLEDNFLDEDLIGALNYFAQNPKELTLRSKLGINLIKDKHSPRVCASKYFNIVENYYAYDVLGKLSKSLKDNEVKVTPTLASLVSENIPPNPRVRRILFDVSELSKLDAKTGIQRVVRAILLEWIFNPPSGYILEPVYATLNELGYRSAQKFMCKFLEIQDAWCSDPIVDAYHGDVFVGVDLQPHIVVAQEVVLKKWRDRGVFISFVVHDILTLKLPQHFSDGAIPITQKWVSTVSKFDSLVCVSRAVRDELIEYLSILNPTRNTPLIVGWNHHGSDIKKSAPSTGIPQNSEMYLDLLGKRKTFLMVGTIEPRKAHEQVLNAFEKLWSEDLDINLVVIGKEGWLVKDLMRRIKAHELLNNKLIYLDGVSDEFLEMVYSNTDCLIAASEGEGFGLPLIEAAQHQLPIIARDIPVFNEVLGDKATYFSNSKDSIVLVDVIKSWLSHYPSIEFPASTSLKYLSWEESAKQLFSACLGIERSTKWTQDRNKIFTYLGNDFRWDICNGDVIGDKLECKNIEGCLVSSKFGPISSGSYKLILNLETAELVGDERVILSSNQQIIEDQVISDFQTEKDRMVTDLVVSFTASECDIQIIVSKETYLILQSIELIMTST